MRFYKIALSIIATLTIGFVSGCGDDDNPVESEELGEISGTVNFVGSWPEIGEIQISVWANWPPAGPPAGFSDPFISGEGSQTFHIEGLSKGSYPVISVGWRDPANPAEARILGIYWEGEGLGVDEMGMPTAPPLSIEIADDKLVWTGVNITANLDIAH